MTMRTEIAEQPDVFRRAWDTNSGHLRSLSEQLAGVPFSYALVAARGTSDNAARYAKYLWGAHNRIPVALAAPSLFTSYLRPPDLSGALVVGISQSGESPDLVAVMEEARRQNRPTLVITNSPESPMAAHADVVIDIAAGEELAVAATKTYTAQLFAVAMLSAALDPEPASTALAQLPELVAEVLSTEDQIESIAGEMADIRACAVLGRGYNHSTAYEWALKLQEITYALAHPYSTADFRHGPIAVVEPGFPIFAVAAAGALQADMDQLIEELTTDRRARTVVIANRPDSLAKARHGIPIPDVPEWMSPIPAIVAAQLFTYHLGTIKGLDTDQPRGLTKVTRTV